MDPFGIPVRVPASGSNTLAIIFLPTVHTVVAWREVRTFVSNDLLPLELSSIDIFFFVNDSSRAKGLNLNEKADGQDLLGPARREPRPCPPNKQPAAAATDTVLSSINIIIYKHNSRVRGNVARPLPSRRETSTGVRFSGVDPEGESRERERERGEQVARDEQGVLHAHYAGYPSQPPSGPVHAVLYIDEPSRVTTISG